MADDDDGYGSEGSSTFVQAITLNISSSILALQSPHFYKLLENGSKEVTLKISASEKGSLLDVLNFMYIDNLSATTDPELQAVRYVAAKYKFISCIDYCSQLLNKSRNPLKNEPPLKEAAKNYLVQRYKDFTKSKEDAMTLPPCALEVVLGSDGLQVISEEEVFDFILKWGREHYPKLEERREILTKRFARLIYFPYMCYLRLEKRLLVCPDFDVTQLWWLVHTSLQFNAGFPYGQGMLVAEYPHEATSRVRLIKRVYKHHPVKVDYNLSPPFRCAVHFYLTKEECNDLFRSREKLYSQAFFLHRKGPCFYLFARCNKDQHTSLDHFGLFLYKPVGGNNKTCTIDCEFQVMKDPSEGFQGKHKADNCTLTEGECVGNENMFGIPWTDFMADDSKYFIDGILHLVVDITQTHPVVDSQLEDRDDPEGSFLIPKDLIRDFGFLFNEMDFSDRVLRIEIRSQDEDSDVGNDSDGCSTTSSVVKVTTLNINSRILASESSFFYKLFENGMKESHQKEVTLRIDASEEASLMDLLNAMYINILSATTTAELLGVLIVADKFEVISCIRYCCQLLEKSPTPLEYELCHRELPCVLMDEGVEQLKDAAKKYIVARYMDFNKFQEEAMGLPLCALEVILGSDGLQVRSEEDVFNLIVKWGRANYPKLEERREILTNRLARFIYFQCMCPFKLWIRVIDCPDFERKGLWKVIEKSLQLTGGFPYGQRMCVPSPNALPATTTIRRRVYEYHQVKVEFLHYSPLPCIATVVHFYLTRQECTNLLQSRQLSSQTFFIHGLRCFRLLARCNKEDYFGLFLYKPTLEEEEKEEEEDDNFKSNNKICTIHYEFQVMKDPSEGFESKHKIDRCTLTRGDCVGNENLFGISWNNLMADDSRYFIDGILHLRVQLTLIDNSQPC